jgi:hypothetical protein
MLVLALASALWTIFTVKIDMKGVRARVSRGDTLMTVFTVKHKSLIPVASVRIQVNVPSSNAPTQEISVNTPPFAPCISASAPSLQRRLNVSIVQT